MKVSKILDPESRIHDPGSRILDPGSWIRDPGSWIQDPGDCQFNSLRSNIFNSIRTANTLFQFEKSHIFAIRIELPNLFIPIRICYTMGDEDVGTGEEDVEGVRGIGP